MVHRMLGLGMHVVLDEIVDLYRILDSFLLPGFKSLAAVFLASSGNWLVWCFRLCFKVLPTRRTGDILT